LTVYNRGFSQAGNWTQRGTPARCACGCGCVGGHGSCVCGCGACVLRCAVFCCAATWVGGRCCVRVERLPEGSDILTKPIKCEASNQMMPNVEEALLSALIPPSLLSSFGSVLLRVRLQAIIQPRHAPLTHTYKALILSYPSPISIPTPTHQICPSVERKKEEQQRRQVAMSCSMC
jgi:hypothetical protein